MQQIRGNVGTPSFLTPSLQAILKRILGSGAWNLLSQTLSRAATLATTALVARSLGIELYGKYGVLQSTLAVLYIFSGFGIASIISKLIAEYRKDTERTADFIAASTKSVLGYGGLVAVAVFILASPVSRFLTGDDSISQDIRLLLIVYIFGSANGLAQAVLVGLEEFKLVAYSNIVAAVCALPLTYVLTKTFGLPGAILGLASNVAVSFLCSLYQLKRHSLVSAAGLLKPAPPEIYRRLNSLVIPSLLSACLLAPTLWLVNAIMLKNSGDFTEMGIFSAARQIYLIIQFIPLTLSMVIIPILSNTLRNASSKESNLVIVLNLAMNVASTVIICIPIFLYNHEIMTLFGISGGAVVPTLNHLLIAAIASSVAAVTGNILVSYGQMWLSFYLNLSWAIIIISLELLFKDQGAIGISKSFMYSYLALAAIAIFATAYAQKIHTKKYRDTE